MTTLASTLAGTWYAGDARSLKAQVRGFLDEAPPVGFFGIRALLVPHAGFDYSGPTAAAAYREVEGQTFDRAILIGPSHRIPLRDQALVANAEAFQTPLGDIPADAAGMARLLEADGFRAADPDDFLAEHSVQIQFPFLQETLPGTPVLPILSGRLTEAATELLACGLRSVLTPDTLVIISSDFTHFGPSFGYVPFRTDIEENLRRLDLGALNFIQAHDRPGFVAHLRETGATICGADPIVLLMTLLHPDQCVHRLAYTTSGRETGDWSHSVSYLAAAVTGPWNGATGEAE